MSAQAAPDSTTHSVINVTDLITLMRVQEAVCQRLLEVTSSERRAVQDSRLEDLEQLVREKESLVDHMDSLEAKRHSIAERLNQLAGLSADSTLADLAERVGGSTGSELLSLRAQVRSTVAALQDANSANMSLMRESLSLVKSAMRQIRKSAGPGASYTQYGRPTMAMLGTISVDRKA